MNFRNLTLIVLALGLFMIVTAVSPGLFTAGPPELIRNGSFENGNFADDPPGEPKKNDCNCKLLCGGSTALNDWQVTRLSATKQDCASAADAVAWWESPNPKAIVAFTDHRALDLTGYFGRPPAQFGRIQQSVEGLRPGATYELSFVIGTSSTFPPQAPPGFTPFYRVVVDVAGVANGNRSFDPVFAMSDVSNWTQFSMRFAAVNPSTTITFSGSGSGGDYLGLDSVSLQRVCWMVEAVLFGCP